MVGFFSAVAGFFQEFNQEIEAIALHVAELAAMGLVNRLIKLGEEGQASFGDGGADDAAIGGLAMAGDQAAFFQAIQEAGHIGVAGNHAAGDFLASEAAGSDAAENAEDIILCCGEAEGFEDGGGLPHQGVGGFLQI